MMLRMHISVVKVQIYDVTDVHIRCKGTDLCDSNGGCTSEIISLSFPITALVSR